MVGNVCMVGHMFCLAVENLRISVAMKTKQFTRVGESQMITLVKMC